MHECYKTDATGTHIIDVPESGCWVNVMEPDQDDRTWLAGRLGVVPEFIRSAFDEEETSHIDFEDEENQVLVTIDYPSEEGVEEGSDPSVLQYTTHPITVIFLREPNILLTVSLKRNHPIQRFRDSQVRGFDTRLRTRFLLQLLLIVSQRYQLYLRRIDRLSGKTEISLRSSMRNEEIIQMLSLEKSLVYFSTSLKGDESVLTKISAGRIIKLYDEDQDLLEDVLIEIRQAIEMCNIYSNTLPVTMDAFASVISNNLNIVMKSLTVITIVIAIPNIVFGFYGMNVSLPGPLNWIAPLCVAAASCLVAVGLFKKMGMF